MKHRRNTPQIVKTHVLLGKNEGCMECHGEMTGFSPYHDPNSIGCSTCHGGNATVSNKRKAHKDMILIPGNMSDLNMTCGATNCHIGITKRVRKSIMNTMQGVIAVNQSVMDYDQETNPMIGMHDQDEHSATGTHSRQLCYSCHLGNPKTEVGPIVELSRGGGCNACHLNYTEEQAVAFEQYKQERNPEEIPSVHPSLTLEVGNDKCFGCHSRSGRISTNYEGWHETLLPQTEVYDEDTLRTLDDGRIFEMVSEDIHHSAGLECIDCHTSRELMGDGVLHQHKEEAIHVKCEDCHFKKRPATISYDDLDEESKKLVDLRKFHKADYEFVNSDRTALINVLVNEDGQAILISKNKGKEYELSSPVDQCDRSGGHSRLSCQSCHSAWAPQCLGCHTEWDPKLRRFDHLDKKTKKGKWVEYSDAFLADQPVLGVVEEDEHSIVKTFIPGMIMTLDKSKFRKDKEEKPVPFFRLFAPGAPHTTVTKGRTCAECHLNSLAIGYGRGLLVLPSADDIEDWSFLPEYDASEDGLPQDSWIGFLQENSGGEATRKNARAFTIEEQISILKVGTCLTCHEDNSKVMQEGIRDFEKILDSRKQECFQ